MSNTSRSSALESIYQQGYSKGLTGSSRETCPAHIRYARETHSAWIQGWKAGLIEGGHPIPKPWLAPLISGLALIVVIWALMTWFGGDDTTETHTQDPVASEAAAPAKAVMDIPVQTSGFSAQRPDAKAIAWLSDSAPVVDTLYFISQQDEMAGQALTHVWFLNDQQVGRVDFTPSSNHFRSVSQRQLNAVAAGRWTVRVITAQGKVLDEQTILISP